MLPVLHQDRPSDPQIWEIWPPRLIWPERGDHCDGCLLEHDLAEKPRNESLGRKAPSIFGLQIDCETV